MTHTPLLDHRDHDQPSVFTADALLREARRQRQRPHAHNGAADALAIVTSTLDRLAVGRP